MRITFFNNQLFREFVHAGTKRNNLASVLACGLAVRRSQRLNAPGSTAISSDAFSVWSVLDGYGGGGPTSLERDWRNHLATGNTQDTA